MKLALGTVQFGADYGVANKLGAPKIAEIKEILGLAKENHIDTLDTAIAYGASEEILGECGVEGFNIVTKIPPLSVYKEYSITKLEDEILRSIERLRVPKLHGVMFHRADDVARFSATELRDFFDRFRNNNLINKFGVSFSRPEQIQKVEDIVDIDIVQVPVNVIDRRFIDSGELSRLKMKGIEIHTRSVFLQGLLLMDQEEIPSYFCRWLNKLRRWNMEKDYSVRRKLATSLHWVTQNTDISKVLVGVDSLQHLKEIIEVSSETQNIEKLEYMKSIEEDLVDPSRWSLK